VADKVGDEAPDRHLTAELTPFRLLGAQDLPQPFFRFGQVPAQHAGAMEGAVDRLLFHRSITPSQPSPI